MSYRSFQILSLPLVFMGAVLISCKGETETPPVRSAKSKSSVQDEDGEGKGKGKGRDRDESHDEKENGDDALGNGDDKNQDGSEGDTKKPMTGMPGDGTPLPIDPSLPVGWSLLSPQDKATSSDTTPRVIGKGLKDYPGGKAKIFADEKCANALGEASISSEGTVDLSLIPFKEDKSQDGLKEFFVIQSLGQKTSPCETTKLSYTLKTDEPLAEAKFLRLMFKDDPSRTMNIGFAAASPSKNEARIHFDLDHHGRDVESYAGSQALDSVNSYKGMNNAFAQLKNLKPDTVYYFVIADKQGVSPVYSFQTLPDAATSPLSIITGGDSRNNRTPRRNANILVGKIRPHVVFFGGDMTSTGTDQEWKEWFEDWSLSAASDRRLTPLVVARGNHEHSNEILEKLFDIPATNYYALNFGGKLLRGYTLNTEASISGTQTSWLVNDLKANSGVRWKIAQYHKPMWPHVSDKAEGTSQYQNWAKPFYEHRMNLVVESDAHTVKTTWPVEPSSGGGSESGFVRNDAKGTVYIGEGCWGAPLRPANDLKSWTRDSGSFNHFNWLKVTMDEITIRTIKVDNAPAVGALKDSNRFETPSSLDVWAPKNGSMITIKPWNG